MAKSSQQGPRGERGRPGPPGPPGPRGTEGGRGPTGKTGAQGPRGTKGSRGRVGKSGPAGTVTRGNRREIASAVRGQIEEVYRELSVHLTRLERLRGEVDQLRENYSRLSDHDKRRRR